MKKLYSITLQLETYANDADEAMENIGQNINFVLGYEWRGGHVVEDCPCEGEDIFCACQDEDDDEDDMEEEGATE